jgi:hypothetical protein
MFYAPPFQAELLKRSTLRNWHWDSQWVLRAETQYSRDL